VSPYSNIFYAQSEKPNYTEYTNLSMMLNYCTQFPQNSRSRSFASAGLKLWNSLPDDITSVSSLTAFWQKLTTHLFHQLYPDIIMYR